MNKLKRKQRMCMIARRISEVRRVKGVNQQALAQAVGCTQSLISQYESGTVEPPIDAIIDICDALGCSIDYLLGREVEYDTSTGRGKLLRAFEQLPTDVACTVLRMVEAAALN